MANKIKMVVSGKLTESEIEEIFSEFEGKDLRKGEHFEFSQSPEGEVRDIRILVQSGWTETMDFVLNNGKIRKAGISEKLLFCELQP